ncbi:GntR family transcriptional regulator [Streptomyces sp. CA-179760]|uniref:GntR family transcriptional regulator n=1 Tax=Streptomyces sp. CA-179760 TaxID=3240054 RepID=UPI003D90176A
MEDENVDAASNSTPPPRRRTAARKQLPEEVAAYVRDLITSGEVRPGEFLRIERIAEAVGVSQTPVREGLLALKSEGIVNLLPRRGFVVAPITPQDITDLFWAQAQLASELAARAAEKITDAQLERLKVNIEQYATAVTSGDWERIPEIGLEFHREVNRAAQSHRLVLLLDTIMANLPGRYYAAGNPKQTGAEHPELLRALQERDPELARRLMTDHISSQGSRLIGILAERGLWAESTD